MLDTWSAAAKCDKLSRDRQRRLADSRQHRLRPAQNSVARAHHLLRERGQGGQLIGGQCDAEDGNVLLQPLDPLGAGDGHHRHSQHVGLRVHPGERDVRRRDTLRVGDRAHRIGDRLVGGARLTGEAGIVGAKVFVVQSVDGNGPGKEASAQRRVRH